MAHHALALALLSFVLTLFPALAHGSLVQKYCSDQNTATGDAIFWVWQSNGWCHDKCGQDYAFAVVQGNYCWCSNYVPTNLLDVKECDDTCPGYPDEECGKMDKGLFGYVEVSNKPSGTSSGALVSTTLTGKSSDSTNAPTGPITSVQVITESGAAVTKTVTIMPTSASGQLQETSKKSMSGGAIAGAVVGSLAGLAGLIGLLVWFLAYRRKQNEKDQDYENGNGKGLGNGVSPQRHASTLSKAGLLRSEKPYLPVAIPGPTRHSSNGTDGISPVSGSHGSERRNSRPLFYDQRLNPSALMDLDNGSHTSIATIEDNKDYTRTLNVRNPDPPEE